MLALFLASDGVNDYILLAHPSCLMRCLSLRPPLCGFKDFHLMISPSCGNKCVICCFCMLSLCTDHAFINACLDMQFFSSWESSVVCLQATPGCAELPSASKSKQGDAGCQACRAYSFLHTGSVMALRVVTIKGRYCIRAEVALSLFCFLWGVLCYLKHLVGGTELLGSLFLQLFNTVIVSNYALSAAPHPETF